MGWPDRGERLLSTRRLTRLLSLAQIPFQVGARASPGNAPFADRLDFDLGTDEVGDFLVQMPSRIVEEQLSLVYQESYQLGTPMQPDGLGRRYCDDFLSFIAECLPPSGVKGMRLLEVASGTGYLLSRLHREGAPATSAERHRRSAAPTTSSRNPKRCSSSRCSSSMWTG